MRFSQGYTETKGDTMELKTLADELRDGFAWKYLDGPVVSVGTKHSDKSNATDWELVKAAATCSTCGRSATNDSIEKAVADANDMKLFSEIVSDDVEHAMDCEA